MLLLPNFLNVKDSNWIGIIEIERRKAKEMSVEIKNTDATRSTVIYQFRRQKLYQ